METVWSVRVRLRDGSTINLALFKSQSGAEAHARRVMRNSAAILGIVQITLLVLTVNP